MDKKETIAIIRSLLSSTKSPYSVSSLFKDFKNETGNDMPLFGYKSACDFLHSIPDTVKLTGVYPAQQVHLVTNEKSSHIASLVKRTKKDSRDRRKKTSLLNNEYYSRGLINNNRNTLNYQKESHFFSEDDKKKIVESKDKVLPQKYSRDRGKKTSLLNNEYYSRRLKTNNRNTLNYQKESHSFSEDEKKKIVESKDEILPKEEISPKTSIGVVNTSSIKSDLSIPDQVLGLNDQVLKIDLNQHTGAGKYVEVCLCEIYNPYVFYLHFRKNKKKLSNLMSKLQVFYEHHEEMYQIPDASVKPHLMCVALHKAQFKKHLWYRAEIIKVLDNYRVIVNLVDYGISVKTFNKKLRLLHRDFSFLPRQAVLGSLANIKPLTDDMEWSKSACERFRDLASNRDLVAGVVKVKNEIPCIIVALSFTKDVEIHVNDTLVNEGFAAFENIPRENLFVKEKSDRKFLDLQSLESYFFENSSKNFPTVENNTLTCHPRPIFYVPKNDRLKKLFSK